MSSQPQVELTSDGSCTLFVPALDEHYHSVNGAIQESRHVFFNAGLTHCAKNEINIFEVGFGTGLNALLAQIEAENSKKKIIYTSVEAYPISGEIVEQLNYPDLLSCNRAVYENLHAAEWNVEVEISEYFSLHKIWIDFSQIGANYILPQKYDLVFFDAFAPDKQPEMWSKLIFEIVYKHLNHKGILCTYCAKGAIRRIMQEVGFRVERLPGPPGKREMLRATKL